MELINQFYSLGYIALGALIFIIIRIVSDASDRHRALFVRNQGYGHSTYVMRLDSVGLINAIKCCREKIDNKYIVKGMAIKINELKGILAEQAGMASSDLSGFDEDLYYVLKNIGGIKIYNDLIYAEDDIRSLILRLVYDRTILSDNVSAAYLKGLNKRSLDGGILGLNKLHDLNVLKKQFYYHKENALYLFNVGESVLGY